MRVLVIGNGAREHALAYGLSQDPSVTEVHISPGNPGMAAIATLHPEVGGVPARGDDGQQMRALAQEIEADLVVIGPEIPLVAGVADVLREAGFAVFGPSAAAAQIEGSKAFAKEIMAAAGVATATAEQILPGATEEDIHAAIDRFGPTWVVKDDGLAGGKGVVVTPQRDEAIAHVHAVHAGGNPVLLESFLDGPEISLFCLVDGETVVPLLPAQDHKRVGEGDTGPNTGGMGAYTPLPWLPEDGVQRILDEVVIPVARQMKVQGCPFNGLLYAGLAWGEQGPAVVEFNCRFGDPETQAVLDLLRSPLGKVLHAVAVGELDQLPALEWEEGYALTVVLAAEGYPEKPITGVPLHGVQVGQEEQGIRAAGVSAAEDGTLLSAGGRVLNVIAHGSTLEEARIRAYEVLEGIHLEGGHYRRDIALPAVEGKISL